MHKNTKALLEDERPTIAMCYGVRRCFLLSPLLSLSERFLKTLTNQNLKSKNKKANALERKGPVQFFFFFFFDSRQKDAPTCLS